MLLVPVIVFICLFGGSSALHLYFCYKENEKARKISKPFAIFFLTVAIIFLVPKYPLIYLFPFFSLLGDVALIWKRKSKAFFILGFGFFFIAHLCNLAQMTIFLTKSSISIPVVTYVIYGISLALIIYFLYPITKKIVGPIALLGNIYMPTLLFIGLFSLLVTAAFANSYQGLLIALGYVFFIFSDGFLIYSNFIKDVKRHDFYVMSSYLIAELLIALGLSMLVVAGVVA